MIYAHCAIIMMLTNNVMAKAAVVIVNVFPKLVLLASAHHVTMRTKVHTATVMLVLLTQIVSQEPVIKACVHSVIFFQALYVITKPVQEIVIAFQSHVFLVSA